MFLKVKGVKVNHSNEKKKEKDVEICTFAGGFMAGGLMAVVIMGFFLLKAAF